MSKKLAKAVLGATHLYAMLNVGHGYTEEEIRQARNEILRQIHPDRMPEYDQLAHNASAAVNRAASILSDEKTHKKYRIITFSKSVVCLACRGEGSVTKTITFSKNDKSVCTVCGGSGYHPKGR